MAQINAADLTALRQTASRNFSSIGYTKPQINAALQAIEDRMTLQATKNTLASDIEAATPGMFNASEKQLLFGIWCVTAAKRLGVLS